MTIEQRLDLEREDYHHEGTQARLGDRLKFAYCRQCGSPDGMKSVHRDTMGSLLPETISLMRTLHSADNSEYLYYACPRCNRDKIIPTGFVSMSTDEVLDWLSADPMAPDYAALAAEPEAVSQIGDSRDAAGLEG